MKVVEGKSSPSKKPTLLDAAEKMLKIVKNDIGDNSLPGGGNYKTRVRIFHSAMQDDFVKRVTSRLAYC